MQVKVYDNSVKKGEKKNKVLVRTSEQVQEELKEKENYLKEYYGNDTEKAEQEIEKLRYKRRSTSAYSSTQRTKKQSWNIFYLTIGNIFVLLLLIHVL